jgi:hypothetical protein
MSVATCPHGTTRKKTMFFINWYYRPFFAELERHRKSKKWSGTDRLVLSPIFFAELERHRKSKKWSGTDRCISRHRQGEHNTQTEKKHKIKANIEA